FRHGRSEGDRTLTPPFAPPLSPLAGTGSTREPVETREPLVCTGAVAFLRRRDREHSVAGVVESDDRVESQEERVGHAADARVAVREGLEEPCGVVGEVAHRAAKERG